MIVVTNKVKAFIRKLGWWVRELEGESLDMFSCLNGLGQENSVETSYALIIMSKKINWLICSPAFLSVSRSSKWLHKRITDPFHVYSPQNYDFSLFEEENYIYTISDISLKVQFPRNSYIEFWVVIGRVFPHISRKALNIVLPSTTSYLYETAFSAVTAIKTKYYSMMNLENNFSAAIQNSSLGMITCVQRSNHIHPTKPCTKSPFNEMYWIIYSQL
jgi:hypothetical protein